MGIRKGSDALKAQLDSTIIRLKDEGKIDEFMNRRLRNCSQQVSAKKHNKIPLLQDNPLGRVILHPSWAECPEISQEGYIP